MNNQCYSIQEAAKATNIFPTIVRRWLSNSKPKYLSLHFNVKPSLPNKFESIDEVEKSAGIDLINKLSVKAQLRIESYVEEKPRVK
jgi:hypothetical protein